jgi:GAF domain-containing protein
LTTKAGYNLGTMCVIDRQPRELSNGQISALRVLGQQASLLLETRREYNLSKYVLERERNQTRALQETLEKVRRIVN